MIEPVVVTGRFVTNQNVAHVGRIKFIPSRLWVDEGEQSFATLSADVELVDGRFSVLLTPTQSDVADWHYSVVCPGDMGTWTIWVEPTDSLLLRDLLPSRFRG